MNRVKHLINILFNVSVPYLVYGNHYQYLVGMDAHHLKVNRCSCSKLHLVQSFAFLETTHLIWQHTIIIVKCVCHEIHTFLYMCLAISLSVRRYLAQICPFHLPPPPHSSFNSLFITYAM